MAQWPTDDELLAAVRAAGWLLESQALRVLAEADLHPRAGWAFADPDDPTKSRELDVWAFRRLLHEEATKVEVSVRFLVECKQSSNPYVGVGYELPEHRFRQAPAEHVLALDTVRVPMDQANGTYRMSPAWTHFGFDVLARNHRESNFRVNQLTRLDHAKGGAWSASNDGVFTSLVYPLAKALDASKKDAAVAAPAGSRGAVNRVGWTGFALHFPVVLLSCPLYIVDATQTEPQVKQRAWATATRQLKTASVSGTFEIDVVTEPAFADYVADRLAFAQAFADMVGADALRYTGESEPPGC